MKQHDSTDEFPLEEVSAPTTTPVLAELPAMIPKKRGFAAMSPEVRSALSSRGGRAAQQGGKAHRFTSEEARAAGTKGGAVRRRTSATVAEPALITSTPSPDATG